MDDEDLSHVLPDVPTSEVGCNPNGPQGNTMSQDDEKWRMLLEQQNRNFLALVQAMKTPSCDSDIRLPEFDPDKGNLDARAWINTADMCVPDQELQGAPLMMALSRALKGQTSAWFSQVSYHGMCWTDFKDLFISRYDCPETPAAFLINLHGTKPKDGECLAAYAATLMTSLMSQWKNLTVEQISVSVTLAHMSQFDSRVQRTAFTHDISNRHRLQQELKAISFLKRKSPSSSNNDAPEAKRARETVVKCYNCGKLGHKAPQCRHRRDFSRQTSRSVDSSNEFQRASSQNKGVPAKPTVTCFQCKREGHYASNCPDRRGSSGSSRSGGGASSSNQATEKRVDVCTIGAPVGALRHSGIRYEFTESLRGCRIINVEGYRFNVKNKSKARVPTNKIQWRCSTHGKHGCKAVLFTARDEIIYLENIHTHPPATDEKSLNKFFLPITSVKMYYGV